MSPEREGFLLFPQGQQVGKYGRGCYKTQPVKAVFRALPLGELNLRGHPEDLSFEGLSQMNVTPNPSLSP